MARRRDLSRPDLSSTRAKDEYLEDSNVIFEIGKILGYVVDMEMRNIHGKQMESVRCEMGASENTVCDECSIGNLLPCPYPGLCKKRDGVCTFHKNPAEMCRPCPNRICDKIRENIENMHVNRRPNWRFTRAEFRCTDHNELVKCYIPDYLSCNLPPTTDISALVCVIINNTELSRALSSSNVSFDRLRQIRNEIAHSNGLRLSNRKRMELLCMKQKLNEFINKDLNDEELEQEAETATNRDDLNDEDRVQEDHATSLWNNWMAECCLSGHFQGPNPPEFWLILTAGAIFPSCFEPLYAIMLIGIVMVLIICRWCIAGRRNVFCTNAVERNNSREKDLEEKTNRIVEASLLQSRVRSEELLVDNIRDFKNEALEQQNALSSQTFTDYSNYQEKMKRMNEAGQLDFRITATETLSETVREFKEEALAQHMEINNQTSAHRCATEDAKHELRKRLARFYHDIKVSPFISQKTKFDLADFYVRSRMHIMDKIQWSSDDGRDMNDVKSYKDLLYLNNSQARNVFLLGDSGEGKSMLNLKLALDWSHRYLNCSEHTEQESEESSLFFDGDILQTFEYLFYVDLKGCTRGCEMDDIIKERLIFNLYSFHEREDAYKLVEEVLNTERCMIIADNTEEWKHPTNSACLCTDRCLPLSVKRPLCTFVFTMRPWMFFQNCSVVPDKDNVIKVNGVSDAKQLVSKIIVILQRALPSQKDCCSMEFKRYLTKRQMESLLSNPMYLVYLVCLWYEGENWAIFDSRCKVFSRLIRINLSKETAYSQDAENVEVFPQFLQCFIDQTTSEFLRSVSCLAFEAYTATRTRDIGNSLVNEHLDPQTLEQALDIGILSLISKHSFTTCQPKTIYYFTNPTMQDFLFVLYLFSKRENNGGDLGPRQMFFLGKRLCLIVLIFLSSVVQWFLNMQTLSR
ncbi:uncharacterized protein LOC128239439 [Mya arenaria]|uniref:uncharacterized protein LOC128239439 n=1 Tax=Mya arenaria TaxID=6604 RepID=UPI0022E774D0|nr:uncharacterized protein LOC128239439 [Mya arenaria]